MFNHQTVEDLYNQISPTLKSDDKKNCAFGIIRQVVEIQSKEPMTKEQLTESFNTWFQEEGKFQVPEGNYTAIKELLLIAWLNSAHIVTTHNT